LVLKQIRQVLITATITLGIFCSVLYISCNKSKCGSTTCQNGGTCSGTVCICPEGYSGNGCQTGWSDEFIGTYNCTRGTCTPAITGAGTWQSAITKDANNSGFTVDISNFDDAGGVAVIALVDSIGGITISPAAGASGIHATGTYSAATSTITLDFTTLSGTGTTFSCHMTMVKL
jgi:hypothetical protein